MPGRPLNPAFNLAGISVFPEARRGGMPYPLRSGLEELSGMDLSDVRVHLGSAEPAKVGAHAYTHAQDVYVAPGQERHLPHEGWHVVQQMQGRVVPTMRMRRALVNDETVLEREADRMGGRALELGGRADGALDAATGRTPPARTAPTSGSGVVQRYAFIQETQVNKKDKSLNAKMKRLAKDKLVRDYETMAEFKSHAAKKTDYVGNVIGSTAPGTWVRFEKTGMNILGENHTEVPMHAVVPAVGSDNFIRERFSSDDLSKYPKMRAKYEADNKDAFKKMGIKKKKNKRPYGGESLFPKLGYTFTSALPYFKETKGFPLSDLESSSYFGKPVQRYLKIGWAFSKDNAALKGQPPKAAALATVHASVTGLLNPFIKKLKVDGFLGDELKAVKGGPATLLPSLTQFAEAMIAALAERAATDPGNRLTKADRATLASDKTTAAQKGTAFGALRNLSMEDTVKAAAARGVRYAGMGQLHLLHLQAVGMPAASKGYDMRMVGKEMVAFIAHTKKLEKKATP